MNKSWIVALLVVGALFYWWRSSSTVAELERHDDIIMYCLKNNPVCQVKAEALRAEGIEFIEYYVDEDRSKLEEVQYKLVKGEFDRLTGRYEFPIFDVRGVILVDNPDVSKIKKYQYR